MGSEHSLPAPWLKRLYLPTYSISSAAKYVGAPIATVRYWHYSSSRLGPALPGKERGLRLSYFQLIEVAFVATFRQLGVSLQKIRKAHEYARQTLEAEFPFAQLNWYTEGSNLLLRLKEFEPDHELDSLIIADSNGQTVWAPLVGDRFGEFEYENGIAIKWHVGGMQSPVLIDPRISFGAPMIKGVPTWVLKGRRRAGESASEIAQDFSLDEADVAAALAFEGIDLAA